ncbi:hypothetical protein C9374_006685 [Naegleria lovaniensis]|uniref:Uncharacterized protein n=1 Tax=Naegleria lovaniensis TaxID=51637 RepID=A0AA88GNH8_NAELO|nr:uncharacterized protein C9374_006685 [Naegleria lovaniensis]KAG2379568.1 hypothetical protein C9374_006685 [Naegleria lovaniensis]
MNMDFLSGFFGRAENKPHTSSTPISVDSYSSLDDDEAVHEALMSPVLNLSNSNNGAFEHSDDQVFLHGNINNPTKVPPSSNPVQVSVAANPISDSTLSKSKNNHHTILGSLNLTHPSDMDMSMISSLKADIGFISKASQKSHPACAVGVFELSNLSSFHPQHPHHHDEEEQQISTPIKQPSTSLSQHNSDFESEDGFSSYSLPSSCKSDRMISKLSASAMNSNNRIRMKSHNHTHGSFRKEYLALTNSLNLFLKEFSEQVLSYHALHEKTLTRWKEEQQQQRQQEHDQVMNEWSEHVEKCVKQQFNEWKTWIQSENENTRINLQQASLSKHDEKQYELIRELHSMIEENHREIKTLKVWMAGAIGISLLCVMGQIYSFLSLNR